MEEEGQRCFGYHCCVPLGIPGDFPSEDNLFVLKDVFGPHPAAFRRLLQCGNWQYTLRLDYNTDQDNCVENRLLSNLYDALKKNDRQLMASALQDCGTIFWSSLTKKHRALLDESAGAPQDPINPFRKEAFTSIKLQVKTVNGVLESFQHDTELATSPDYFLNQWGEVPTFFLREAKFLERITQSIYRVSVAQVEYCLKTFWYRRSKTAKNEIKTLLGLKGHPNITELKGILVNDEKGVLGMLTPFIQGETLFGISECTEQEKVKWKKQLKDAVEYVHGHELVWGDAKPDNVMVDSAKRDLCLIDFEGGLDDDWIPFDLAETEEGDNVAVSKMLSYIDSLSLRRTTVES